MGRPYRIWIMRTADGFYPIEPSAICTPEDHGRLNPHVERIEDLDGKVLWRRRELETVKNG